MAIPITLIKVVFDVNQFLEKFEKPVGRLVKWVKEKVEQRGEQKLEEKNFKLVAQLFGIEGNVGLRPSGEHPQFGTRIHPDDQETLFYLTGLINSDKLKAQGRWIVSPEPAYNIICLGGPVANLITRQNMGYQRRGDEFLRLSDFPINFPFLFDLSKKVRRVTKRYTGGRVHKEYNWPIITPSGLIDSKVTRQGWLDESYLIITRMPNLSNESTWREAKDLLIISGTHGTGTRAVEQLFGDQEALSAIVSDIGGARYYQSLLRIPSINHDVQRRDSFPSGIEHIKSEALLIDNERIDSWFRKIKEQGKF